MSVPLASDDLVLAGRAGVRPMVVRPRHINNGKTDRQTEPPRRRRRLSSLCKRMSGERATRTAGLIDQDDYDARKQQLLDQLFGADDTQSKADEPPQSRRSHLQSRRPPRRSLSPPSVLKDGPLKSTLKDGRPPPPAPATNNALRLFVLGSSLQAPVWCSGLRFWLGSPCAFGQNASRTGCLRGMGGDGTGRDVAID